MVFKKRKVKLSLIDDYIRIILIENFYNNSFDAFNLDEETLKLLNKTKTFNLQLKNIYDELLEKLNLNDISLLILKKELKTNNTMFKRISNKSFLNLLEVCERNNLELNLIELNLKQKLKTLKLTI